MEAHRFGRLRSSHIFYTIGSQMAVRLPALRAGHPLAPGRFLVLISFRGCVDPRAIVQLEGLDKLKNILTSSGFEPSTCSILSQPTTVPRALHHVYTVSKIIFELKKLVFCYFSIFVLFISLFHFFFLYLFLCLFYIL
jgi:hypothetical protein